MNYKRQIQNSAKLRGVEYCVHFSKIDNLDSILQYGLLPKKTLDDEQIEYFENDTLRLDNHTDSTSVSITSPNYKMFYKYRMNNPSQNWVVLILEASAIFSLDCAYCYTNAANTMITSTPISKLMSLHAFEHLFSESANGVTRARMNLEDNEPTDPQAEILVFDEIPPSAIKFIIFNNWQIMQYYASLLDKLNIAYSCDRGYFYPRHDYAFW